MEEAGALQETKSGKVRDGFVSSTPMAPGAGEEVARRSGEDA